MDQKSLKAWKFKIQIELDEKNINDFKEIVKMLELNGFKFINKLRNDNYHKNIKFSEVYNYLFEKKGAKC